jgi:hypothetical protein
MRRDVGLEPEDVGCDGAGLSGVVCDPDKKGDNTGVAGVEVFFQYAFDNRPESCAVLNACVSLEIPPL